MRTGLYQGTTLKQEMKINPRLYQAMDLLYMPLLDLQQHLKQELLNNPFLDLVEPDAEDEAKEQEKDKEKEDDEIDWEEILLNGFETGGRREEYEEREYYEPVSVDTKDLGDHLHDQLTLLRLSERELLLGEEIIGNVSDEGYLVCDLEETVVNLNNFISDAGEFEGLEPYELGEAELMLRVIQGFDPPRIAARDLRECILLQLRDNVVSAISFASASASSNSTTTTPLRPSASASANFARAPLR